MRERKNLSINLSFAPKERRQNLRSKDGNKKRKEEEEEEEELTITKQNLNTARGEEEGRMRRGEENPLNTAQLSVIRALGSQKDNGSTTAREASRDRHTDTQTHHGAIT